jgi:cation transport ATPase
MQVDTVVFDKTGTLTAGKPVVAGITMFNSSSSSSISPRLMLQLAAAVEQQATHPVGKALVAAAAADRDNTTAAAAAASSSSSEVQPSSSSKGSHHQHSSSSSSKEGSLVVLESAAQAGSSFSTDQGTFLQEPGSGAVAVVAGHRVSVGTLEWVQRQGAALTSEAQQNLQLLQQQQQALKVQQQQQASSSSRSSSSVPASKLQSSSNSSSRSKEPLTGHTQVFVGVDGAIVGLMDVADMIRADARSTVQELQQLGLRTVMLSGDRQEAALKVRRIQMLLQKCYFCLNLQRQLSAAATTC